MTQCYIGLGSNLHTPLRQLNNAIKRLRQIPRSVITHISDNYKSSPLGIRSQPLYFNKVIGLQTSLDPYQLLKYCQTIETDLGRFKKQRWGARIIDIDILLYGTRIIKSPFLCIPHPEILKRDFVLQPLLDIAPHVCFPNGEPIHSYGKPSKAYLLLSKNLG